MRSQKWLFAIPICLTAVALAQNVTVLPSGAEIKVRTDIAIPARPPADATYSATVSSDVISSRGELAIPRSARAELVAVPTDDGKDTNLDMRSVIVNDHKYLLVTKGSSGSSRPGGLGANKRTGKYVGGGAAVGAVLGAILGGGKGAAIGAILGGAGGAGAQVYTGKKKELPPETQLSFKLAQDLEMESVPLNSDQPGQNPLPAQNRQVTQPAPPPQDTEPASPQSAQPPDNSQPPQHSQPPDNPPNSQPENAPPPQTPQSTKPQDQSPPNSQPESTSPPQTDPTPQPPENQHSPQPQQGTPTPDDSPQNTPPPQT